MKILDKLPRAASADRRLYIGASDAAAVLGMDPHRSAFDAWAAKVGATEPEDESVPLLRGRFMEAGTIQWAAHALGAAEIEPGVPLDEPGLTHPDHPWLALRPDGALHFANGESVLVEAKSSDAEGFSETDVPDHYGVQALMQMAVVPVGVVVVPVYAPIRRKFWTPRVERDDEAIAYLLNALGDWFYRHLDPHGPRTAPAYGGSRVAADWLMGRHPTQAEPIRLASSAEEAVVREFAEVKAAIKQAEAREAELANLLREACGDAEGIEVEGLGKVTWRAVKGAETVDSKRLRAEFPDVWEAVKRKGDDRRDLRWWPKKEGK